MKENILETKSISFAVKVVKTVQFLNKKNEFVLSKQFLRSGTSIGANVQEAIGGQSKKDFFAKLTISYKESRETMYWLMLLKEGGYISENDYNMLSSDCEELCKIIGSIQRTIKLNS